MSKDEFRREVEKKLTGKETEPWEIVYFKLYKSQIPVIEQAIDTAALMLGSDKSRSYCLEMICADFLAGANLDNGSPEILLHSIARFFKFNMPSCRRFLSGLHEYDPVQTSPSAASSPILRAALSRSLAEGWMAMSGLRQLY